MEITRKEQRELRRLEWQDKLKKQQRGEKIKKYGIWGSIGLASVLVLFVLVKMAGTTSAPQEVNVPKMAASDIVLGKRDAPVTLTEYADFQCPACASYHPIINRLLSDYDGKLKLVYRFFPLKQIHKNAQISAQAGFAANKQGKFKEMYDILFEEQNSWANLPDPRKTFEGYAKDIDLDVAKFTTDMNSNEAKDFVNASEKQAISLGLTSTPTFVLNNKKVSPNGFEEFKKLIDSELAAK